MRGYHADGDRGIRNVAAFLRMRDLSKFDPKAPPPHTEAWHEIVNASRAPEDAELADVLDHCGWPDAITLDRVIDGARRLSRIDFAELLSDRKYRRTIPHRMEDAGYLPVRNRDDKRDGQWRIDGKRQTAYARRHLSERERLLAARKMAG